MNRINGLCLIMIIAIISLSCSDSVPLFEEMSKGRADKLERIEVTPGDVTLDDASYCMLSATGYYNDGSTDDLTTKCEWASDDPNKAVVSAGGYVQARTLEGSVIISARYDTLNSQTKIKIDIRLAKIDLIPSSKTLDSDNQVALTATGTTTDGAVLDLTKTVTWTVDPFTKGTVNDSGLFIANDITGTVKVKAVSPDGNVTSNESVIILKLTELFVDASFTAEAGDGTKTKPYAKIHDAIEKAKLVGATRIIVAKGAYIENLIVDRNISLYGGYNPVYTGGAWARDAIVVPSDTTIQANGNTAIIYTGGLTEATVLDGFRVIGGNSSSSTSNSILCSLSSPAIKHNEIYGGLSTGVSVGILAQTSSPVIKDNPIISGGLPGYAGGGADNFAILCQSFSNPVIEGNGSDTTPSQTITGPAGGESTYRIKCESSSNAIIKNNTIETTIGVSVSAARGILAISSSPLIEGNTIESATTGNMVIRGENTSAQIKGNSIGGSIYITSGSMNTVIDGFVDSDEDGLNDGGQTIEGDITVTGASTGVSIRNHVCEEDGSSTEYLAHYGRRSTKYILGAVTFDGNSSGTVEKNVMNRIILYNSSYANINKNIIINSRRGIYLSDGSSATISRNCILVTGSYYNTIYGIGIVDHNTTTINNNIIIVENTDAGMTQCVDVDFIDSTIILTNNLIISKSNSSTAYGIGLAHYNISFINRFYNNIFLFPGSPVKYGIVCMGDNGCLPELVQNNYFIGTPNYAFVDDYTPANNRTTGVLINNLYSVALRVYANNADETSANVKWARYSSSYTGLDLLKNDFHLQNLSTLKNKGRSSTGVTGTGHSYITYDWENMTPDFDGVSRLNPAGDDVKGVAEGYFAVGPYEYAAP